MINETLLAELISKGVDVLVKEETVSTNTDGRELVKSGISRPSLIVADCQSGGRGRQGKSFLSPSGGLYMTLVLPTDLSIERAMGATSCAAIAVCRGIEQVSGIDCGIKWINDIYVNGKKLCGILTESINDYENMTSKYLILGVGINVSSTPIITDSSVSAISLAELGYDISREVLCGAVTEELINAYRSGFNFADYAEEYRKKSILLGREISFFSNGLTKRGIAQCINDRGALVVLCGNEEITLDSGEVSVRYVTAD